MMLKINPMTWDDAERTGFRNITVSYNSNNVMAVLAHKTEGTWNSTVVPMGYSYDISTIKDFVKFFEVLPSIMEFLESTEVLTYDAANDFINKIY